MEIASVNYDEKYGLALLGWSIHDLIYHTGLITLLSKAWPYLPVIRDKILGKKERSLNEENYEKDVVYLFQFPGTKTSPSISPFSVKVEAFCRLHNIKYKKRCTIIGRGSNNKLPFVELNGEPISDSQITIKRLTEKMQLQVYPDAQSAAVGHTIDRMLDIHTFNLIIHSKLDKLGALIEKITLSYNFPSLIVPVAAFIGTKIMRSDLESRFKTSVGIFTDDQYKELLRNDLVQLQTILGKKKFLLGEEPTAVDCTALGQLGVAYYTTPAARTSFHDLLDAEELNDLKKYVVRTKESIYGNGFYDAEAKA